jgi:hypothetical protein
MNFNFPLSGKNVLSVVILRKKHQHKKSVVTKQRKSWFRATHRDLHYFWLDCTVKQV